MRSTSGSGASAPFSDSASEMRRPQPHSSVSTAASRAPIQPSRASVRTASISARAAGMSTGRGRRRETFGPRMAATAGASMPSASASQR